MSKRGDRELLLDIKEAIDRITGYTANMNYAAFLGDTKTQDAAVRNIKWELVWSVINDKAPKLLSKIENLLRQTIDKDS